MALERTVGVRRASRYRATNFEKREKISRRVLIDNLLLYMTEQRHAEVDLIVDPVENADTKVVDDLWPIQDGPEALFRPMHNNLRR